MKKEETMAWTEAFVIVALCAMMAAILIVVLLLISGVFAAEPDTAMLRSLPYVDFSPDSTEHEGIILWNQEQSYSGYNFYCERKSGHVYLLEMNGDTCWHWQYTSYGASGSDHAELLPDGGIMVIRKLVDVQRLDKHSNVLWKRKMKAHHDITKAPDGTFYTIIKENHKHRGVNMNFDVILHLAADGQEIDRWSTHEHLGEIKANFNTESFFDTWLNEKLVSFRDSVEAKKQTLSASRRVDNDYFHINSIEMWNDNALLVCFRNVNQIAVIDRNDWTIYWTWGESELEWPHHATKLYNSYIVVFDNGIKRKCSRVIEVNSWDDIRWQYPEELTRDFFSQARGAAQRLPNGNTLITESDKGHVIEVTTGGEIVWEWINPRKSGGKPETVYRMLRYSKQEIWPWMMDDGGD
jgi:hypothetical protein